MFDPARGLGKALPVVPRPRRCTRLPACWRAGPAPTAAAVLGSLVLGTSLLTTPSASRGMDREPVAVTSAAAMRTACRDAEGEGPRSLLVVEVPEPGWSFAPEADPGTGFLPVDTRRNLRVFEGRVELLPARLEPVGFYASEERMAELRAVARRGGRLRLGFFLGFDNHHGTLCLVRSSFGVTLVKMDVAFAELLDTQGRVVARDDTERLRAWMDDLERDGVPGEGPRGIFADATLADGPGGLPGDWQRALDEANRGAGARALARCHRRGLARGAAPDGQVVLRLAVDGRSGRVDDASVALSSIGDDAEGRCIADAARASLRFPPRPVGSVSVSVVVRLAR